MHRVGDREGMRQHDVSEWRSFEVKIAVGIGIPEGTEVAYKEQAVPGLVKIQPGMKAVQCTGRSVITW
jgi:hypothetical protein